MSARVMSNLWMALAMGAILAPSTFAPSAFAQGAPNWATSWTGSAQGPYPVGNPSAQPDQSAAFPQPAVGAKDQSFRLITAPSLWGTHARLRFSNVFGAKDLTLDDVFVGLQWSAGAVVPDTNQPVRFGGASKIVIPPGRMAWSDPVPLAFTAGANPAFLVGRKLAVSFHVVGESGPMTWHAKALQTSYVTAPGAGSKGAEAAEAAFPYATSSWFFLDALDMSTQAGAPVVVAFGDSITDGTASVMNGDDRWPNVLARRLQARFGNRVAVVDAGIGGNQIVGPKEYGPDKPFPGGPSALSRLERDVIGLSGVATVIWLEGINDFSKNGGASLEAAKEGMRQGVATLRARAPQVRVIGATLTPALGSSSPAHGSAEQDEKRKALNEFIRTSGLFDATVDFDAATRDPATGGLKAEMIPESTAGGPGDKLHPNRVGYQAMGHAIDLDVILPPSAVPRN